MTTDPVVTTGAGAVRGRVDDDGTAVFLGLPYAAPPFGPHRFGRPAPAQPWEGVRDAFAYGPTAPQPHRQATLVPEPVREGDDCLNLNVFTPSPSSGGGGLPVLFWLHGGGFTAGCNASPWYHGGRFCRDGVVVVAANYRLGAEGFLAIEDAPLNRAIRDWVAALEWVHENIAAFGGDPAKVTIAGQSAGGVACASLATSPAAEGLFRSAICMSGSRMTWPDVATASELTTALAAELGVPATRAGFSSVDPAKIVAGQDAIARQRSGRAVGMAYGPVIDDEYVPAKPYELVRSGARAAMPLMVSATAEEFNGTAAGAPVHDDEERLVRRLTHIGLDQRGIDAYRAAMPGAERWQVLGQAVTDSTFKAPAIRLADAWVEGGGAAWLYDFEWRTSVRGMGAVHCLDIPFAFDNLDADGVTEVAGTDPPQAIADELHRAWVRFVVDGDPGWDRYDLTRRAGMVIDETSKVVDDPWHLARTTFLANVR